MRVSVAFRDEQLDLDVPDERLVAQWHGPAAIPNADPELVVRQALDNPREYPPLRQAVVADDRVVIAFDHRVPEPRAVLVAITRVLAQSGVSADTITVLVTPGAPADFARHVPAGASFVIHDPGDTTKLAYLASSGSRRIYLNRLLTDADFVPAGCLGYDSALGYRGPWGMIFPARASRDGGRV